MIARGFRPVVWVFMISVAVLGCYMLNLRVAAERAELAKLDRLQTGPVHDVRRPCLSLDALEIDRVSFG